MTIVKENHDDVQGLCDPLPKDERQTSSKALKVIVFNERDDKTVTTSHLITKPKRKRMIIFAVLVILLIYLNLSMMSWHSIDGMHGIHHSHVPGMKGYLVWSDHCKIPNLDPYASDIMKYFKREKYETCSTSQPLTNVQFNATAKTYILQIDEKLKDKFTKFGGSLECCYHIIERNGAGIKADQSYRLSKCLSISKSLSLPSTIENILVKCSSKKTQTYINAHTMIPERPEIRKRLNEWKKKETKRPISVLMIGVDSLSRQNLIRAMPKTAQHLYDSEWFEMSGYNKVDDNTFPNFLALFAGYNSTTALHKCDPTQIGSLDKCPFVWYDFRKYGYVTAYAEDEAIISTFNYLKAGFQKPPTDYYIRPFLLAAEKYLPIKHKNGLNFCLGYQHAANYIYDYAIQLATTYSEDPYFGLFWTNSFSHNAISDPSSMDEKIVEYLQKFENYGILNKSVVIFFSDHGIRFGPTRKLPSGRIEERLPFFFVWLPAWFKNENPEFVNSLNINKNRLTNPYDIHMTLKHIIELSGRVKNLPHALDCPNCQSLLKPVPENRTCEDISIEDHWCTCVQYKNIYKYSTVIQNAINFTINYINNYLETYKNGSLINKCGKIYLDKINFANMAIKFVRNKLNKIENYQFVFGTKPGNGLFEATVRYDIVTEKFHITGISRLNSFAKDSKCISDGSAKKYCSCINTGNLPHSIERKPING